MGGHPQHVRDLLLRATLLGLGQLLLRQVGEVSEAVVLLLDRMEVLLQAGCNALQIQLDSIWYDLGLEKSIKGLICPKPVEGQ